MIRQPGYSERWSSVDGRQGWRQKVLTATVRVFCNGCNSGWMSGLEKAAKPIVGPMVAGKALELDADAQRIVADWVALKGLVAAQTSKVDRWIPDNHYRRVHDFRGAPPNTMRVWVGCRSNLVQTDRPDRVQWFDFHFMPVTDVFPGSTLPPVLERYRSEGGVFNGTVLQVGHFFALALQHDWPGLRARAIPTSPAASALLPMSATGPTVHWPPPRPADHLGDPHKVTRFLELAPPVIPVAGP
jgi:hypothetical protein